MKAFILKAIEVMAMLVMVFVMVALAVGFQQAVEDCNAKGGVLVHTHGFVPYGECIIAKRAAP